MSESEIPHQKVAPITLAGHFNQLSTDNGVIFNSQLFKHIRYSGKPNQNNDCLLDHSSLFFSIFIILFERNAY